MVLNIRLPPVPRIVLYPARLTRPQLAAHVSRIARYVSFLFEQAQYIMLRSTTGRGSYICMRTLVDLLSDECGYVRIFAELSGYSYELSTYRQRPIPDLFERMHGYACVEAACEAGRFQLLSMEPNEKVRRRRTRRRTIPSARLRLQVLPLEG